MARWQKGKLTIKHVDDKTCWQKMPVENKACWQKGN